MGVFTYKYEGDLSKFYLTSKPCTYIAVLSLLTFYSGSILAQSLMVYSQAHLSADQIQAEDITRSSIASNSSRLGFKGEYELTESLTFFYQYESGVDFTFEGNNDGNGPNERGVFFTKTRPSFIGIESGFGKLLVGHMPGLDQWANEHNLFADQIGDLGNFWEASGAPGRIDDVIYYELPSQYPINLAVTYVPKQDGDNDNIVIIKGGYQKDNFTASYTHSTLSKIEGFAANHKVNALTAGYQLNNIKLWSGIQQETNAGGQSGNDIDSLSIGLAYQPNEKGKLKIQAASLTGSTDASDSFMWALGYDYQFNNNIMFYVAYAETDNDSNANYSVNGKGHGEKLSVMADSDPYAISLGIVVNYEWMLVK